MVTTEPSNAYGTRSGNRLSNCRPNYAEDQPLDGDGDVEQRAPGISGLIGSDFAGNQRKTVGSAMITDMDASVPVSTLPRSLEKSRSDMKPSQRFNQPLLVAENTKAGLHNEPNDTASKKRKASAMANPSQSLVPSVSQVSAFFQRSDKLSSVVFPNNTAHLESGKLIADNEITYSIDDQVYLVCEPAGEPYYLARIMEFIHAENSPIKPVVAVRVNWFYRPRDIQRPMFDSRQVYATMHSDRCPISSIRGKCFVSHRSEITDLNEYRRNRDSFWYEKLFDKYIHRFYEVIPTSAVINVPSRVKRVLDGRWKFIVAEPSRAKELSSDVKTCHRCRSYAASHESVECAVCRWTYHMSCINPPLLKKPTRGFAWSCGTCSRAQERRLEARINPHITERTLEDDDHLDGDEVPQTKAEGHSVPQHATASESPVLTHGTEQLAGSKSWPFRYLGIHCKTEDALDHDDRIYPRAGTRLGPKHQAIVPHWPGQPFEYVRPVDTKRKHRKDQKLQREAQIVSDSDRTTREARPPWIVDQPHGFIVRGLDAKLDDPDPTAKLIFSSAAFESSNTATIDWPISTDRSGDHLDYYMQKAHLAAITLGIDPRSVDFQTRSLEQFQRHAFDPDQALMSLQALRVGQDLNIPQLSAAQLRAFEQGVSKYGSELYSVTKHINSTLSPGSHIKHSSVVRFYYLWKKTPKGREIWGNFAGRRGKKDARNSEDPATKLADDLADDEDDSAYDNEKAIGLRCRFRCRFCKASRSRIWRRAPGPPITVHQTPDPAAQQIPRDRESNVISALCQRCAVLWRRYGIPFEDIDEVAKRISQTGGRAARRRVDEDLLQELLTANAAARITSSRFVQDTAQAAGLTIPEAPHDPEEIETDLVGKRRVRITDEVRDGPGSPDVNGSAGMAKKKKPEKTSIPPVVIEFPEPKTMPCAVCQSSIVSGQMAVICKDCRMTVHHACYGLPAETTFAKWVCDTCTNDRNTQTATAYKCVLCPVESRTHDFIVAPRPVSKKKTDKDRERERLELEAALQSAAFYEQKQVDSNKPILPREALKRTTAHNWIHVQCAIWTPEVQFGDAANLDYVEGVTSIPPQHFEERCAVCRSREGACVRCQECQATVHVTCAQQGDYLLGFEILPVKTSRKDVVRPAAGQGEIGVIRAIVRCGSHTLRPLHAATMSLGGQSISVIQAFAIRHKQVKSNSLGAMHQASIISEMSRPTFPTVKVEHLTRQSTGHGHCSLKSTTVPFAESETASINKHEAPPTCTKCGTGVTPRWWHSYSSFSVRMLTSVHSTHTREFHQNLSVFKQQSTQDEAVGSSQSPGTGFIATDTQAHSNLTCHKCHWFQHSQDASAKVQAVKHESPPLRLSNGWSQNSTASITGSGGGFPAGSPTSELRLSGTVSSPLRKAPPRLEDGSPSGWMPIPSAVPHDNNQIAGSLHRGAVSSSHPVVPRHQSLNPYPCLNPEQSRQTPGSRNVDEEKDTLEPSSAGSPTVQIYTHRNVVSMDGPPSRPGLGINHHNQLYVRRPPDSIMLPRLECIYGNPPVQPRNHSGGASASPSLANLVN